jgi:hypothetical protein
MCMCICTTQIHLHLLFWGRHFIQNMRMKIYPKFFLAEIEFCRIGPWNPERDEEGGDRHRAADERRQLQRRNL